MGREVGEVEDVGEGLREVGRDDLITILTEPRNAIVKQFQRFFGFDGIELVFSGDADAPG